MRKLKAGFLFAATVLTLTACGSTTEKKASTTETSTANKKENETAEGTGKETQGTEQESTMDSRILIAYFSRAGENYKVGYIEKGNTRIIAEMIAEETGGELFEIRPAEPYPEDYDETTEIAQKELREGSRPELAENLEDIGTHDVIYLGFPNWWGDMPMAVYTFLESHDFSGKTIIPFVTHEGSGLSGTESSIADTCSGAEVLEGLAVQGSVAQNSQEEAREAVTGWLGKLGR